MGSEPLFEAGRTCPYQNIRKEKIYALHKKIQFIKRVRYPFQKYF